MLSISLEVRTSSGGTAPLPAPDLESVGPAAAASFSRRKTGRTTAVKAGKLKTYRQTHRYTVKNGFLGREIYAAHARIAFELIVHNKWCGKKARTFY